MSIKIIKESNEELIKAVRNNSTYKKIKSIVDKYEGFELYSAYRKGDYIGISFRNNRKNYVPEVYFDSSYGESQKFEISTISYGALSLDEYEKFLKSCNNAYNMCRELEKIDMSGLVDIDEYKKEKK